MRIFFNDKPLDILSYKQLEKSDKFELVFDDPYDLPPIQQWRDDILFKDPSVDLVIKILYQLRTRKLRELDSITLVTSDKPELKSFIKSRFFTIKAAGGIVIKDQKVLLIYRLGKWDFPKGKFEKKESPEQCAVREVEEECMIKVKLKKPICNTWHTYTQDRKSILKKTFWYTMACEDDKGMAPQTEEGIEDIRWFGIEEAKTALINSYPSMRWLFKQMLEKNFR